MRAFFCNKIGRKIVLLVKGGYKMYSALNDEELIKKHSSTVYKIAYSITSNRDDADDVFQNVFLTYIRKRPTFKNEEHEKAWFIRVTINTAKNYVTQAWKRNTDALDEDIEAMDSEKLDLDFALKQLSPQNRTIIFLFYYEGYKTDEIANMMKMKSSTVRSSLSRSRDKLKQILEKEGYNV